MSISAIMSNAVGGMNNASARLATAAKHVANPQAAGANPEQALYDMIGAKIEYETNASVFETGADMWDVLKTILRD